MTSEFYTAADSGLIVAPTRWTPQEAAELLLEHYGPKRPVEMNAAQRNRAIGDCVKWRAQHGGNRQTDLDNIRGALVRDITGDDVFLPAITTGDMPKAPSVFDNDGDDGAQWAAMGTVTGDHDTTP